MRLGQDVLGMDLYSVLEVPSRSTAEEIRQAYRRLVRGSHPDLYPGSGGGAERRMVELNVAASVLLDPLRRGEYDRRRTIRRRISRRQRRRAEVPAAVGRDGERTAEEPDPALRRPAGGTLGRWPAIPGARPTIGRDSPAAEATRLWSASFARGWDISGYGQRE